jgi:hypothetical protein
MMAAWPLWWLAGMAFAFRSGARVLTRWWVATAVWLPSAGFVYFVWWALRNFGR